jgi:hypothetical protein
MFRSRSKSGPEVKKGNEYLSKPGDIFKSIKIKQHEKRNQFCEAADKKT